MTVDLVNKNLPRQTAIGSTGAITVGFCVLQEGKQFFLSQNEGGYKCRLEIKFIKNFSALLGGGVIFLSLDPPGPF